MSMLYPDKSSSVAQTKAKIDIKELIYSDKGIAIGYNKHYHSKVESGRYPKKGDFSVDYRDSIDGAIAQIAKGLLDICGLDTGIWHNDFLRLEKINFYQLEDKNGLNTILVAGKLKSKNELLGQTQSFSTPKIPQDVLVESGMLIQIKDLLKDLQEFYNGDRRYEQTNLFE